jgi:hypothetical protein
MADILRDEFDNRVGLFWESHERFEGLMTKLGIPDPQLCAALATPWRYSCVVDNCCRCAHRDKSKMQGSA